MLNDQDINEQSFHEDELSKCPFQPYKIHENVSEFSDCIHVRMSSGGPIMQIVSLDEADDTITTRWVTKDNQLCIHAFNPWLLQRYDELCLRRHPLTDIVVGLN